MMKNLLSVIAALLVAVSTQSQVPQGLQFQAVARDNSGNVLSSTNLTVRMTIYRDNTGVWTEDHETSTNSLGLFSLVIGDPAAVGSGSAGSFDNIDWGDGIYSMGTAINAGAGFVELGETQFQSVPYALHAGSADDPDGDPTNEIQDLSIVGTTLYLSKDPTPSGIDLSGLVVSGPGWQKSGDSLSTFNFVGIGTKETNESSLAVQGLSNDSEKPLFEVRRKDGVPVFAVFNDGVMVYVDENTQSKGVKGGFAVGGYSKSSKGVTQEYLRVTSDSVRIYVPEDTIAKGVKGGFAVGGYRKSSKGTSQDFLYITPDSIRMYVPNRENDPGFAGLQGGFAVNTFDPALGQDSPNEYIMGVNRGITRFNTADNSQGFAIGSQGDGWGSSYLQLTPVNTFVGFESGISNNVSTSPWDQQLGAFNIFMGYRAGRNNVQGAKNIFIGNYAGYNQKGYADFETMIGFDNIFIGDSSGYNMEGNGNIFLGRRAGYGSTEGYRNVFIGRNAGKDSQGADNIVLGNNAGDGIAGTGTTVIGNRAGTGVTGDQNTILGSSAGFYSGTGSGNTLLGSGSGYYTSFGSDNLYAGYNAGYGNSDGNNNVFLGSHAGYNNYDGTGNIFIGSSAGFNEPGSNRLYIENSSSAAPLVYGDFLNDHLKFNAWVAVNAEPDNLYRLHVSETTSGNYTAAIFGQNNLEPYFGIGIEGKGGFIGVRGGSDVTGTGVRYGVVGYASGGSSGNYGVYGSSGGGQSDYAVYASGNLAYTGALINASDGMFKRDISDISAVMGKLMQVAPRSYNFDAAAKGNPVNLAEGRHYGFVAQELEMIFPELVVEVVHPGDPMAEDESMKEELTYKGVMYMELIPVLLKGMQEQQNEIDMLKQRITELESSAK
jgi:hypothetical protein